MAHFVFSFCCIDRILCYSYKPRLPGSGCEQAVLNEDMVADCRFTKKPAMESVVMIMAAGLPGHVQGFGRRKLAVAWPGGWVRVGLWPPVEDTFLHAVLRQPRGLDLPGASIAGL